MQKTNTEYRKKYLNQFTRPDVKVKKELYDMYKAMVQKKGYDSINDYVNSVLGWDMENDAVPHKKDINIKKN